MRVESTPIFARPRYTLSCIVPVFNDEPGIAHFLGQLHATVIELADEVELVVINDGSSDRSAGEILRAAKRLPIHYIELSRRFGKEAALQAGLDVASGDCVLTLDGAALRRLPAISGMVDRWKDGVEMIYATNVDQFRLLDAKVVEAMRRLPERNRFMKGLYAWVGFKSEAIELPSPQSREDRGGWRWLKLLKFKVNGLTSSSITPLRCVAVLGFVFSMLSLLMGCWIVLEKAILGQPIPGFATLAAAVFFLSGVQLMALGVVGEYVGRIFEEVKQRPSYLVTRELNKSRLTDRINDDHEIHPVAPPQLAARNS